MRLKALNEPGTAIRSSQKVLGHFLGSVAHYSAEPCLSEQVSHSQYFIGLPGPCGPCANLILGPHRPYLVKKTGFGVNILGSVAHYSVEPCLS